MGVKDVLFVEIPSKVFKDLRISKETDDYFINFNSKHILFT